MKKGSVRCKMLVKSISDKVFQKVEKGERNRKKNSKSKIFLLKVEEVTGLAS